MEPALYLIPVTLGETNITQVLPTYNSEIILNIKHFIVENIRSARRFLKQVDKSIDIDTLTFYELNKHTNSSLISNYLFPLTEGNSIGILSEAGCPAIADPGSDVVAIAQKKGCKVVPLVGPSSILLSLMGSGFNGQSFAFHGYLPIDSKERRQKIELMEQRIFKEHQTQLFIETPYRNERLVEDLINHCNPNIKLCIAMNLTCEDEFVKTLSVQAWKDSLPDMHKKPCIFVLYK